MNIVVNDIDAKEFTGCRKVLVVTELVVSGTQCTYNFDAKEHDVAPVVPSLSA